MLQKMTFKDLPDGSYFWRSRYPEVWIKIDENAAYDVSDSFSELTENIQEEVVLFYPFEFVPNDVIRRQIINWTKNPNAHIFQTFGQ